MARQVAQAKSKGAKPRIRKGKWITHSWRCAFSSGSKCCCSCGNKFHGTGITIFRG